MRFFISVYGGTFRIFWFVWNFVVMVSDIAGREPRRSFVTDSCVLSFKSVLLGVKKV